MDQLSQRLLMGAAGASVALPLPEFVSSSSAQGSSPLTVTAPTGIQDGDLLVAVSFATSDQGGQNEPPTGFSIVTQKATSPPPNASLIATKIAASESGNYVFTAGSNQCAAILVYRNATCVNTVGEVAGIKSSTLTATSITPTYRGALLAFYGQETSSTVTTAPSGMTQRVLQAANPTIAVYELNPQEAAATGDKVLVLSGNSDSASYLFQVTNEPTTGIAPEFVASATKQNSSGSTSLVIDKPTGTVEGDLMVAVMAANGGTLWSGDTAWTEVADQGGTSPALRVAYKVAGASEGASYTFTNATNRTTSGCILTYRYAAYDTIAGSFTAGANPLVLTSISPSESQSILIAAGARAATSVTLGTPTGMTARVTDNEGASPSYIVCDQTVTKGPTGTRSMPTGSGTNSSGIMLAIKPTRSL
jgi:hypothetical protein